MPTYQNIFDIKVLYFLGQKCSYLSVSIEENNNKIEIK